VVPDRADACEALARGDDLERRPLFADDR
jgi:hypothetical protein